jgi:hypothetical protein
LNASKLFVFRRARNKNISFFTTMTSSNQMIFNDFVQLQCSTLKQSGIQLGIRGSFLSLSVPYCGVSIALSLELSDASASSSATSSGLIVDIVVPREIASSVSLADFPSLHTAVPCVATNRNALLNVVSEVMQHVASYHAAKARAIANERWQFELQTTLAPRTGVQFYCPDDGLSVTCSVPLVAVELPKYYSLYGTDTRAAALLVRFDLARMTSHAPAVAVTLPNRLERMLHTPMTLPAWSTGTCLSEYVPLVARFLGDFCHSERIRRSVFSSLVKLLGSRLEIDHVHYMRGRFMRRSSATNPPSIVILHVDLPLEFPAQPPRLGISCLTWLDQTTNRPFSREVPHSWATADLASLDSLATAIAQPLLAAVDSFVRKASNGSRGTVYFLQRPEQSAAAPRAPTQQ